MAFVASQLIKEITAHAQRDSLKDAREICADGTYFSNNLCILWTNYPKFHVVVLIGSDAVIFGSYRRFGTTYPFHLRGSIRPRSCMTP